MCWGAARRLCGTEMDLETEAISHATTLTKLLGQGQTGGGKWGQESGQVVEAERDGEGEEGSARETKTDEK